MNTKTFYNPKTNQILTGKSRNFTLNEDEYNLGYKKIAEAFTSVSEEERKKLWLSLHGKTYSFDFSMLNSKLRHKLTKLGIKQFRNRGKSRGQELLEQIKNKKK